MKACSRGHQNPASSDFCVVCGQQLSLSSGAPEASEPARPTSPWGPAGAAPASPVGATNPWPTQPVSATPPWPTGTAVRAARPKWPWALAAVGGAIALVVLVVALGGGSKGTPTSGTSSTKSTDTPATSYQSDGEQMRELLDAQGYYIGLDTYSLEGVGEAVCEGLAKGLTEVDLIPVFVENGLSRSESVALIAVSVVVMCPWEA